MQEYNIGSRFDYGETSVGSEDAGHAYNVECMFGKHSVLLDNQADITILHTDYLDDYRRESFYVSGHGGQRELRYIGMLKGFANVVAHGDDDVVANVLCMADVEDEFRITYVQGQYYIVHMPDGDLTFWRRGKFYVADMSAWLRTKARSYVTVRENEARFSK